MCLEYDDATGMATGMEPFCTNIGVECLTDGTRVRILSTGEDMATVALEFVDQKAIYLRRSSQCRFLLDSSIPGPISMRVLGHEGGYYYVGIQGNEYRLTELNYCCDITHAEGREAARMQYLLQRTGHDGRVPTFEVIAERQITR